MNIAAWQRIEQLYHEALEQSPEQRSAWLAACTDDADVRDQVVRLLAANEEAEGFLSEPVLAAAAAADSVETAAPLPLTEKQISHYRVLSRLGAGGMGEVYLAKDQSLGRQAALKVLPATFTADADRLRRFEREARAASALNHPNILTIYEIGVAGDIHFIATEYVEGVTLRRQMTDGRSNLRDQLAVILQVALALKAAHQAGIVHRDIKPENVMVRPDGLVKVLDFGLAQVTTSPLTEVDSEVATAALVRTEPGQVMGTPRYMSPEQARGQLTDARTDIFSLGVMLYECVTGQPPFPGTTLAEVFAALLHQEPEPLTKYAPAAPAALVSIVNQALRKEREQRYQTMAEFAADLERVKRQLENELESSVTRQQPVLTGESVVAPTSPRNEQAQPTVVASANAAIPRQRAQWLPAALMALLLGGGWAAYQYIGGAFLRSGAGAPPPAMTIATENGAKAYLALSPDGAKLAYVWDGGKTTGPRGATSNADIYVRTIGADDFPKPLTNTPADETSPTWSPNGNRIAFLRDLGGKKYGVFLMSVLGGPERQLPVEASSGLSWSPDGKTLAITSAATPADPGSVFLVPVEPGGSPKRLTTASTQPPFTDIHPHFSPDGKQVAFLRQYIDAALDLYVVSVADGTLRQLTFDKRNIDGLAWTADGREIVYALNRGDGRALWRIPAQGGEPQRIALSSPNPYFPTISSQGNRLAFMTEIADYNIYLYERPNVQGLAAPGKFERLKQILPSSREDSSPQFSPDGERIAFSSQRNDSEAIWISDNAGENATQLTSIKRPTGSPRWSPDSKWIAFDSRNQTSADIYIINVASGEVRPITTEVSADTKPSWSSDGQFVYFNSDRSGRGEIWKAPVSGGPAQQMTFNRAFEGFETADGKLFYFTKGRGVYGIWAIPASGGEEQAVPELKQAGYWRSWGVAPEGIYFFNQETSAAALKTNTSPAPTINFFSFATRRITPLATVEREALWWQPGLSISRDGRRMLFAQLDHQVYDILLVENFR